MNAARNKTGVKKQTNKHKDRESVSELWTASRCLIYMGLGSQKGRGREITTFEEITAGIFPIFSLYISFIYFCFLFHF